MTSAVLNLAEPHLRNLFNRFYLHKTSFLTIDAENVFSNTPIEGMLQVLNATNIYTLVHKSDLSRAALLYKYGGFHLDFDALTRCVCHVFETASVWKVSLCQHSSVD